MYLLVAAFALPISFDASPARVAIACPHRAGFIDGPVVPTAKDAKAIFSIVSSAIAPRRAKSQYALLSEDEGRTWLLAEALSSPPDGSVQRGGGGLTMRIDKCTGAISDMHYSR